MKLIKATIQSPPGVIFLDELKKTNGYLGTRVLVSRYKNNVSFMRPRGHDPKYGTEYCFADFTGGDCHTMTQGWENFVDRLKTTTHGDFMKESVYYLFDSNDEFLQYLRDHPEVRVDA